MDFIRMLNENYPWWMTIAIAALILFCTWVAERLAYRGISHIGQSSSTSFPASSIFANIARVCIWLIGIAILFKACFNYDVTGLVAALGVGGIALSLGLQDTLSNLIGGLSVSLGRVVEPGQYIEVLGQSGRVTDINWRHTTIVDAGGSTHLVPNSLINKNSLVDIGESVDARASFLLPVGTDIEAFSDEVLLRVKHEFSGQLGSGGARVVFAGEELGGIKGNVVVNVLRTEASAESGADRAFRAMYPVVRKYSGADVEPALPE